ncbi:H/ACA ribonucleoprotein complex non-core subunit NAF1-like [Pecten maximus]|uniref:H/ACA ribonucleoprotein complex non-core subunit NAF1-like n=1 Tax=Pecten maximus TaxID=6579 RepID=UPI001458429F|nr:H/ACA ribonucleoprotein complex non-core subunit NAF1-like [Pecten maximus]
MQAVETGMSSTNGTTNTVENLESSRIENKNSEISGVETLNVNGQNSKKTTSAGHTADELQKKGTEYREQESSDSDSDSSSSSSSSSSEDEEEAVTASQPERPNTAAGKASNKFMFEDIKTEGEIGLDSLPPIEELSLDIEEGLEMVPVGTVSSVLGVLAIIQSAVGVPPLNDDTILFTEGPKVFGRVFEVFGPVSTPWYSVRFNSNKDIEAKGIKTGMKVFYAPTKDDYTKYVFVTFLKSLKGSDASWKDDNEPPEKYMEYSDDEEERASKSKSRAKDRSKQKDEADGNEGDQLPGAKIRRTSTRGTGRPQKFWKDTEQYGQTDKTHNGWNNGGDSYNSGGPQCSYGNQQGRGGGPRYASRPYSRGGAAPPQHFHYPRPRAQGPFGRPAVFQSEPTYNMKPGPGQFYQDNSGIISPGRFGSPGTQMGQNPHAGNTTFGSNFTNSANEWSSAEGYKPFPLPRQPVTDHRLVMNQDSQIQSFSTPPPTHQNSYNQNGGFDINQSRFPPSPQSTQHITFQSPPPALNTNPSQFNMPPPFLPSSNNTKSNNSFMHNPALPPPPLHPLPMANQQMARPPYPQHPPVFGGQPHFTQGPNGRQ